MGESEHTVTLRTPEGVEHVLRIAPGHTILDAAEAAGVKLPYMCCQGWCLTCAARLLEGEVEHPLARRYFRQDAEGGFILPCSALPLSDCVVLTHRQAAMVRWRDSHALPAPRG